MRCNIEVICYTVHSGNDDGNAGRVLQEKQCGILVLLQVVISIDLMIYTDTYQ